MKTMLIAACAVVTVTAGTAMADLDGTLMDVELTQNGFLGDAAGPTGGPLAYGTDGFFALQGDPQTMWHATNFGIHPDYDNSFVLDFTLFQYPLYDIPVPSMSTLSITGIDEPVMPGTVEIFNVNDLSTNIALSTGQGPNSVTASWMVADVANANFITPGVVVAWNSVPVPTPGALALLGCAGIVSRRRRRA